MRVEYFLQTRVPLFSRAKNIFLAKGVKIYTDQICDALVLFLVEEYENREKCCLMGDIGGLYKRKYKILQKHLGDFTYREYLQQKDYKKK